MKDTYPYLAQPRKTLLATPVDCCQDPAAASFMLRVTPLNSDGYGFAQSWHVPENAGAKE